VAMLSRSLGIDIAVDLMGFTQDGRPDIFAHRAAPLQVSYLGYPGTMGAGYIDYLVADRVLISSAQRPHYSERIVYLPESYQVNDSKRPIADLVMTRDAASLPADGFTFCCFNNSYKITPSTFDVWMELLRQVGGSVLWLIEDNPWAKGNLRAEATRRGVDADRLVFAPRVPMAEHLARHRLADLFLDTLPYNAHTTASDALWAGLPVLTCVGETFAGRVAASLLHAVRLPELVTHTPEAYAARAIELSRKPAVLRALRERLTTSVRSLPLFDASRFARHLEAAFHTMHERHLAGLGPEDIVVQP
jgi:predicted O-linked N-acetylglucosamine transferase (SPINDLY family)